MMQGIRLWCGTFSQVERLRASWRTTRSMSHTSCEMATLHSVSRKRWNYGGNGKLICSTGNIQGTIILFEPSTDENICARTIFDPVTAIAPASDNRTFAIGYGYQSHVLLVSNANSKRYLNGSILIATLKPAFTILHTLTTSRAPSRITGLAWHGSSSKQKTDMLATQTADGDLRVWSVPKAPQHETPTIIRALSRSDVRQPGPSWFAWSKNGRLVQYYDGLVAIVFFPPKHGSN
jgi:WD40 repeat protein